MLRDTLVGGLQLGSFGWNLRASATCHILEFESGLSFESAFSRCRERVGQVGPGEGFPPHIPHGVLGVEPLPREKSLTRKGLDSIYEIG